MNPAEIKQRTVDGRTNFVDHGNGSNNEIIGFPSYSGFRAVCFWLREIALQLAVLNENHTPMRTIKYSNADDHHPHNGGQL